MAASGYTPISLYYSTTAAAAPVAGNLTNGELAINITDGKLYYKDNTGTVKVIAGAGGAGIAGGSNTQVQYNSSGSLAGSSNMTFDGTTLTVNGLATTGTVTVGDASGDALTINSSAVSIPNGLNFDSNTLVIDATNNRVGVGVASPAKTLDVGGLSDFRASVNLTAGALFVPNDSGMWMNGYASYGSGITSDSVGTAVRLWTSGSERMRITSAGVALIGKTATGLTTQGIQLVPAGSSAITGPSGSVPLYINNIGTSSQSLLEFRTGTAATTVAGSITTDGTNLAINGYTNLIFGTNSTTERMRIDSSGNVLVGTTSSIGGASKSMVVQAASGLDSGVVASEVSTGNFLQLYQPAASASYLIAGKTGGTPTQSLLIYTGGTERMRLDSSGNLGLGVTPSASWSGATVFQTTGGAAVFNVTGTNNTRVANNALWNGTGWRYIGTDYASMTLQASGAHYWYTAPSGTAGNAITFTQAMTLDASGNLMLGTTTSSTSAGYSTLWINGSSGGQIGFKTGDAAKTYLYNTSTDFNIYNAAAGNVILYTNATERMRIDSSGNVGIGGANDAAYGKLQVLGSGYQALSVKSTDASAVNVVLAANSSTDARLNVTTNHPLAIYTNNTERMRIDSSGNVGIGTSSPSAKLTVSSGSIRLSDGYEIGWGDNSSYIVGNGTSDTLQFITAAAERMRIDSSGNVGIGTTAIYQQLMLKRNTSIGWVNAAGNGSDQVIYADNSSGLGFYTNTTERFRIDSTGNALFAKAVRATITTDNDLSFDMNAASNFKCTPTAGGALTFTNITSGQTGNIILVNGSNYAITAAATTKVSSTCLATISATGTYWLSYYSDGTNVYVANTGALA